MGSLSKLALALALGLSAVSGAFAEAAAETAMTNGEVRKVDKDAGKITIRHGELTNLGMPAMTMVFRVVDPSMLEQVAGGDNIRFVAEKVNGAYTVTKLEPVKPEAN